jgi:serine/threonine protein kinase
MVVSKRITQRNESGTSSENEQGIPQEHNTKENTSVKKPATNSNQAGIPKTSTSMYIGKKITGGLDIGKKTNVNDTGLNAVSIDTDSFSTKNSVDVKKEIVATSIDTGEFIHNNSPVNNYPLIIDETENRTDTIDRNVQTSVIKKEKVPQQNISLDISSEFHHPILPSENTKEQLGSGVIINVLGSGGMAKVYKIWNEKLEIYRAVKILMPTNQKEQWDRFITEAKITAKLHHPNIIETYDTGEWHSLPYIEMEFIEGDTLADLLARYKKLPSPVCAAIALQVAKALAYAHSQEIIIYGKKYHGIIHRDLKPSNIMVTSSGDVKLMDFGVARPIEAGLHTIATDSIIGTVHYFSPEQIAGYPVDIFTDVYSFGAVLYELLSGQNPFPQNNMVQLIQAKTRNQFMRLEDFNIEMDFRLTSVAQTCLRTDKKERYENCSLIKNVLEDVVSSYNLGTPEQIVELFYRNPDIVNQHYEHFSHFVQQPRIPVPVDPVNESLMAENEEVNSDVEQKKPTDTSFFTTKNARETDLWEKKVKSHNVHLIVTVILFLAIIAVGVFFVREKSSLFDNLSIKKNTASGSNGLLENTKPIKNKNTTLVPASSRQRGKVAKADGDRGK